MADYVFKFGNFIIPNEYIAEGGYDCTPNQRQDLDPFTDQYGVTHRNSLQHTKSDVTISFRALSWAQFKNLVDNLVANYIEYNERDAQCEYLSMETLTMKQGHMYLDPSCKFNVQQLNAKVSAFSLRFTEY